MKDPENKNQLEITALENHFWNKLS